MTFAAAATLLAAGCRAAPLDTPATRPAVDVALASAAGGTIRPLVLGREDKAVVIVFVAADCPVCNASAPTLAALAKAFAGRGVVFHIVYADPDARPADVLKHKADYALPGDALLDPQHHLADTLGATKTPTAYVIGRGGTVLYAGAIDDAFAAVGRKKFAPGKNYLADALEQVLAGRTVGVPRTTAVGCDL